MGADGRGGRGESAAGRTVPWHAGRAAAHLAALDSSPRGLTEDAARRRLQRVGPNEPPHLPADGPLAILGRQFAQPLIYVLVAAAAVSAAAGEPVDAVVIGGVVLLNALIGFVQEYRAGRETSALAELAGDDITVVRDGRPRLLDVRGLVPGDVIVVEAGDKLPADARILAGRGLMVDEALLTGESAPVGKAAEDGLDPAAALPDRGTMLHAGTIVTAGRARALVVGTGGDTELARIARLVAGADRLATPLTRSIAALGRRLSAIIVVLAAATFGVALARGYPALDGFLAAVALAVAAIPEGLPAVVTIALAVGVRRMAARNALVRQLPAVETLGSTTIVCSDKTGTLTRGEMVVAELFAGRTVCVTGSGYAPEGSFTDPAGAELASPPPEVSALLEAAVLCSDAQLARGGQGWRIVGDPTEGALVVAAAKAGLSREDAVRRHPRRDALPFEPEHRFMATLHDDGTGGRRVLLKGAPEVVVPRCSEWAWRGPWNPARVAAEADAMAARGLRVLAVAEAAVPGSLERLEHAGLGGGHRLLGLVGSIDPPKPEAVAAVGTFARAGIRVAMITGDHPRTAQAIAAELGIPHERARTGASLEGLTAEELADVARDVSVFARVSPEHKLGLVAALQSRGEVVAMTGDGANDAPALRQADIGVAMGRGGTDAAREAADVILRDDDLSTIEAAVEEGRRVYDNLVKAIAFVLPTSAGQALLVLGAMVAGLTLPLLPVQVLWINLITAVALALPLAVEAPERGLMDRGPRRRAEPILGRFLLERTALVAGFMLAAGVLVIEVETRRGTALPEARASVATTIVLVQAFYLLACRSLRRSPWSVGLGSNPWIYAGIGAVVVLQAAFVHLPAMNALFDSAPIGPREWVLAAALAAMTVPLVEAHRRWAERAGRL
jgi:magnesium-transporting ATPase (P-type)